MKEERMSPHAEPLDIQSLKDLMAHRGWGAPLAARGVWRTGFPALDALLPGGGLPKGGLTELVGGPGVGKSQLAALLLAALIRRGVRAAYVSARGAWYAPQLQALGVDARRLLQVCPPEADRVSWAAEQIARSGAFPLIVLDAMHPGGGPALDAAHFRRLAGACRAAGAAVVLLEEPDPLWGRIPRSTSARLELSPAPPPDGGPGSPCHHDPVSPDLSREPATPRRSRHRSRPSAHPHPVLPVVPSVDPHAASAEMLPPCRMLNISVHHGRGVAPGRAASIELPMAASG
jgi:hypothetical protein